MSNFPMSKELVQAALLGVLLMPLAASADTADEIKALIMSNNAETRKTLSGVKDTKSKSGSLEFWSSGGLMQKLPADDPGQNFDKFALTPKHIKVITLVEGQAAVAMYYSEGSFHVTGQKPVSHYMTRATVAYVNEDGEWKVGAAHFSRIAAGQGTQSTSLD